MPTSNQEWLALAVSSSFAAGLNVYATIATLGILSRTGVLSLPTSLYLIQDWWVIVIAGIMFALEFVADKIPVVDLVWNALHTFIRVPVGALLAYGATQQLSPGAQAMSAALGGALALVSHSSKLAARTMVTPSPEPVSNSVLSVCEDVGAIGLTWFATHHPFVAAGVTSAAVIALVFAARWLVNGVRNTWSSLSARFSNA
jgi:hypothetical protein